MGFGELLVCESEHVSICIVLYCKPVDFVWDTN